jgi:D-serine deaminase-like pyridoxal phosphate-dependent protein
MNPDRSFIGAPDGRSRLPTPALVLDLDRLDANIAAMAALARGSKLALRPHAKSHKSIAIARRQIAAGAVGLCCATMGEAEIFAAAGIGGLLITAPLVTADKLARLAALCAAGSDVMAVADHPDGVAALAGAVPAGRRLAVLVDLDVGLRRSGVRSPADVPAVARAIAAAPQLRFAGIQAYAGSAGQFADRASLTVGLRERAALVAAARAAATEAGLAPAIVSGGGTSTAALDVAGGPFTELQAGSYVFVDRGDATGAALAPSLFVATAVISTNQPGRVTVDAGGKAVGAAALVARGAPAGTTYALAGVEHGVLLLPDGAAPPPAGSRVELLTPHIDPTVNLYDVMYCVRGESVVDIWPIEARGRH